MWNDIVKSHRMNSRRRCAVVSFFVWCSQYIFTSINPIVNALFLVLTHTVVFCCYSCTFHSLCHKHLLFNNIHYAETHKIPRRFSSSECETAVYVCLLFYRWNANKFIHPKTVSRQRQGRQKDDNIADDGGDTVILLSPVLYFSLCRTKAHSYVDVENFTFKWMCFCWANTAQLFIECVCMCVSVYKIGKTTWLFLVLLCTTFHSQSTVFIVIILGFEWCQMYMCMCVCELKCMMCVCSSSKFCQALRWNYIIRCKNVKRMK